jgi:hypothetical protein
MHTLFLRDVFIEKKYWRYEKVNQKPQVEERQNTMTKRKRTNNDLLNTTQKTKDWATRTSRKTESELMCSGKISSSCLNSVQYNSRMKKSWTIPKGQSESVNRRRTDNTMDKKKNKQRSTKHATEPRCSRRLGSNSCSTSKTLYTAS